MTTVAGRSFGRFIALVTVGMVLSVGLVAVRSGQGRAATGSDVITTIAGTGDWQQNFAGEGGPALAAEVRPTSVDIAPAGSPYAGSIFFTHNETFVGQQGRVVRLTPEGTLERFAGGGSQSPDGVQRLDAALYSLSGIEVMSDGTIYLSSSGYPGRIYRIDPGGVVHTVVESPELEDMADLAVAGNGDIFVANYTKRVISKVTEAGEISTFVGGSSPRDETCGRWMADDDGAGGKDPYHAYPWVKMIGPESVEIHDGKLYAIDSTNGQVFEIPLSNPKGVKVIAGRSFKATGAGCESPAKYPTNWFPESLAASDDGVYFGSDAGSVVRKVGSGIVAGRSDVRTSADGSNLGDGGAADQATLSEPNALAVDDAGVLYIGDKHRLRRVGGPLVVPSPTLPIDVTPSPSPSETEPPGPEGSNVTLLDGDHVHAPGSLHWIYGHVAGGIPDGTGTKIEVWRDSNNDGKYRVYASGQVTPDADGIVTLSYTSWAEEGEVNDVVLLCRFGAKDGCGVADHTPPDGDIHTGEDSAVKTDGCGSTGAVLACAKVEWRNGAAGSDVFEVPPLPEDDGEEGVVTNLTLRGKQVRDKMHLSGEVTIVENPLFSRDQAGCTEARKIVIQKWTQVAGKKTKNKSDDRYDWKNYKTGYSDEFGEYQAQFGGHGGKWRATAPKDAFTDEYGALITCKPGLSKPITI